MVREIELTNGRLVGDGHPAYIVAEIGINHNGSLQTAQELMKAAKLAGADAVKFQKREPRISTPKSEWRKPKLTPWGETMSYIEYRERMEFDKKQYSSIDSYARFLGIDWFSSVWDVESLEFFLEEPNWRIPAFKVPSAKITDLDLLENLSAHGWPVFMSTGMSTWAEILTAVSVVQEGAPLALLHCNSSYPAKVEELDLQKITAWREEPELEDIPIGYSGHETGLATTLAARSLGASIIERHITLDRSLSGSDHSASVEPQGFSKLVKDIRAIEQAIWIPAKSEREVWSSETAAREKLRGEFKS